MKALYFCCLTAAMLLSLPAAAEVKCPEFAVDAADNEELYSHCDYSESPVNKMFDRALESISSDEAEHHRSDKAIDTYAPAESAKADTPAEPVAEQTIATEVAKSAERQIYNIRESYNLDDGPNNAISSLYRQMAKYCPAGWDKLAEWSEPKGGGFYLHYQFQCAK